MDVIVKYGLPALLFYFVLVVLVIFLQRALIYYPDRKHYTQSDVGVSGFTDITVQTSDNLKLEGWYKPAQTGKPTLLMFHGNGSNHAWRAPTFTPLTDMGYGLLLASYRGYGANKGTPSEDGLYRDAEAFFTWLTKNAPIPATSIVLYGESLGTGVAVEMALRHQDVRGLVLEAPYTSIPEVAAFHYPFIPFTKQLVWDKFDSASKIDRITTPKLFMLAGRDNTVPTHFGQRLFDLAATPKTLRVYQQASHTSILKDGGITALLDFLK